LGPPIRQIAATSSSSYAENARDYETKTDPYTRPPRESNCSNNQLARFRLLVPEPPHFLPINISKAIRDTRCRLDNWFCPIRDPGNQLLQPSHYSFTRPVDSAAHCITFHRRDRDLPAHVAPASPRTQFLVSILPHIPRHHPHSAGLPYSWPELVGSNSAAVLPSFACITPRLTEAPSDRLLSTQPISRLTLQPGMILFLNSLSFLICPAETC
jgi:hypothetical protein